TAGLEVLDRQPRRDGNAARFVLELPLEICPPLPKRDEPIHAERDRDQRGGRQRDPRADPHRRQYVMEPRDIAGLRRIRRCEAGRRGRGRLTSSSEGPGWPRNASASSPKI